VYELASSELQPIGRPHDRRKINLEKVKNFQQRKSDAQEPRFHHNLSTKNHPKTTFCAPESAKSPSKTRSHRTEKSSG
jgi:hypothetical protein